MKRLPDPRPEPPGGCPSRADFASPDPHGSLRGVVARRGYSTDHEFRQRNVPFRATGWTSSCVIAFGEPSVPASFDRSNRSAARTSIHVGGCDGLEEGGCRTDGCGASAGAGIRTVTKPRIGVNLLWLLPNEGGGAEEYALRILRAIDEVAGDTVDITLFCNRRFPLARPDLAERFGVAIAPIDGTVRSVRIATESSWLPREAARRDLHLVHHLNNVVPLVRNRPSVVTVHDLRPLDLPGTYGAVQGAYLRTRLGPSVRRSAAVMTPSSYVRQSVIDRLDAPPDRVIVVRAPIYPLPAPSAGHPPIGRPYFIYPAITAPHKNHRTLIEAFAGVAASDPDVALVLTGGVGPSEDAIRNTIVRHKLQGRVRRMGRVSAAHLHALFREAVALTYPSIYEGFGLPIAEAMSIGCPVVASNTTALPEVVGEAGLLLDPNDPLAWRETMLRVLRDHVLRTSLITKGRAWIKPLSPSSTAHALIEGYRIAAAIGRS